MIRKEGSKSNQLLVTMREQAHFALRWAGRLEHVQQLTKASPITIYWNSPITLFLLLGFGASANPNKPPPITSPTCETHLSILGSGATILRRCSSGIGGVPTMVRQRRRWSGGVGDVPTVIQWRRRCFGGGPMAIYGGAPRWRY